METIELADFAAYFIDKNNRSKAAFGSFPTQNRIEYLESLNFDTIVDLTLSNEKKCIPYTSSARIIKYPIIDHKGPNNLQSFCKLIIDISLLIDNNRKIYIHCKGGHGRSGMLAACLLCYRMNIDPIESFKLITEYHSTRNNLKPYWKKIGSPQTWEQKQTVFILFRKYIITSSSPFHIHYNDIKSDDEKEEFIDILLSRTYLGRIIGTYGNKLESRRRRIFDTITY